MRIINQFAISAPIKPKWEKTPEGFLRCRARLLAERVMPYGREEISELPQGYQNDAPIVNMVVRQEDMADPESLRSLEGAQIVAPDHQWLTAEIARQYSKGNVAGSPAVEMVDGVPMIASDLLVTDPATVEWALEEIAAGRPPEISAAYSSDTLFEPGTFNGQPYDAEQTTLRYNHIALIPAGQGRAGRDVRILNAKGEKIMSEDPKMTRVFRVKLKHSNKVIQLMNEEDAAAVEEEGATSGKKLEDTMGELEGKKGDLADLQAEVDELKGELSVYKEKLDALLSDESLEDAAEGMNEEKGEAGDIIENAAFINENGEEDKKKKEEVMNSIRQRGMHGPKLHTYILNSIGINTENWTSDALRGAFKGQAQFANMAKKQPKKVAGNKVMNANFDGKQPAALAPPKQRSVAEKMGYREQK